jgi:methylenetetrahydrofolate--tRNA-(uracil-5-)-methyltransferase
MRPVGLREPGTGRPPYAVLQLRRENAGGSLWNLVGCQTGLRFGAQERIFRMIPALAHAEFERYGVIHRNSFLKSPRVLLPTLQTRKRPDLLFAGQIVGSEGYVEAAAGGLVAGLNLARVLRGEPALTWPATTAIGGLLHYVAESDAATFQPMHVAFGLMAPLTAPPRKKEQRKAAMAERALRDLADFAARRGVPLQPGQASPAGQ